MGESGGRPGKGCEGAGRPGGAAHPGTERSREGQESSPAGAGRVRSETEGGAEHGEWNTETFRPFSVITKSLYQM